MSQQGVKAAAGPDLNDTIVRSRPEGDEGAAFLQTSEEKAAEDKDKEDDKVQVGSGQDAKSAPDAEQALADDATAEGHHTEAHVQGGNFGVDVGVDADNASPMSRPKRMMRTLSHASSHVTRKAIDFQEEWSGADDKMHYRLSFHELQVLCCAERGTRVDNDKGNLERSVACASCGCCSAIHVPAMRSSTLARHSYMRNLRGATGRASSAGAQAACHIHGRRLGEVRRA